MDKETLSNYGWVVICVLVMVVMIALATPFGSFVSEAVQSTTKGLFDVNKSALDNTGLINIDNQEFDVPDMNHNNEYYVSGTWILNEDISLPSDNLDEHIEFTVTSDQGIETYNNFVVYIADQWGIPAFAEVTYNKYNQNGKYVDGEIVYTMYAWSDKSYKTITFTSEQTVSKEFYDWLIANATK